MLLFNFITVFNVKQSYQPQSIHQFRFIDLSIFHDPSKKLYSDWHLYIFIDLYIFILWHWCNWTLTFITGPKSLYLLSLQPFLRVRSCQSCLHLFNDHWVWVTNGWSTQFQSPAGAQKELHFPVKLAWPDGCVSSQEWMKWLIEPGVSWGEGNRKQSMQITLVEQTLLALEFNEA